MRVGWTKPATKLAGSFLPSHARNREKPPMNDQFPPPSWFMRPETWPYWMPNSLLGARTPSAPPRDVWDTPWPAASRGGILGKFAEPDGTRARNTFTGLYWAAFKHAIRRKCWNSRIAHTIRR